MCPATLLVNPVDCSTEDIELVARASARAGFDSVSLWASFAVPAGPDGTRAVFDDAGVAVRVVEAVSKWIEGPEAAVEGDEAHLELATALGAEIVSAATIDQTIDLTRAAEGFAAVCRRAADRGMRVAIEFIPFTAIPDLETAWRIVHDSRAENGGIVIDMLHWYHQPGGPNIDLLTRIPAQHIHYVQVCDTGPIPTPSARDYLQYALGGRLPPGNGLVDIPALLRTLGSIGADPYFALEVYNSDLAKDGAEKMAGLLSSAAAIAFA
jgi:sugar phosphate isomerase/epimerase